MDGTLEVRLLGTPLMRIANGQGPALQESRVEHVGDVSLLSAGWRERKPDAEAVREWLDHLIPEGEASTVYRERAQHFLKMHGEANVREPDVAARIWGNADREYAGGVSFRALDGDGREIEWDEPALEAYRGWKYLADALRRADYEVTNGRRHLDWDPKLGQTSLSGMKGKLGVHIEGDMEGGAWRPPRPAAGLLSTHIVKVEDDPRNPGEAAMESLVQTTLKLAGVRAAPTWARVIDGLQVVVSERSDRIRTPGQGRIGRRHQEEWAQAAGVGRREKFAFERPDPGLDDLLALLAREGAAGEVENGMEAIGACILLGHTDMHRKNLGIRHPRLRGPVRLAPLYDVSSSSGRAQWITRRLALPAGGAETPDAFGAEAAGTLVGKTALGAEEAVRIVKGVAGRLQDALSDAVRECKDKDEVGKAHGEAYEARIEALETDLARRCLGLKLSEPARARETEEHTT